MQHTHKIDAKTNAFEMEFYSKICILPINTVDVNLKHNNYTHRQFVCFDIYKTKNLQSTSM